MYLKKEKMKSYENDVRTHNIGLAAIAIENT